MRLSMLLALSCGVAWAVASSEQVERLRDAARVFQEVMQAPDQAIPQELLDKAECAVIVPGLKRAAFIVGARYGKGYISCRKRAALDGPRPEPCVSKEEASASRSAVRRPTWSCW